MKSVLILGAEDSPALIAAESYRKRGIRVVVGCHKKICTSFFSKYPHKRVIYPSPDLLEELFVKWLTKFLVAEKIDVVIPVGGRITQLLSKYKDDLIKNVNLFLVDFNLYMKAMDKAETMKIANNANTDS